MSKLENRNWRELFDLLKLIDEKEVVGYAIEEYEKYLTNEDLVELITEKLEELGYDGDNNYDNIFWFVKGLKLQKPHQLTRYIDTNYDYLFKFIKNNINRKIAKDDSYVIKKYKDYRTWKTMKEDKQIKLVNDIMNELNNNPNNWTINFEDLNNNGRTLLFPKLKAFFDNHISKLVMTNKYRVLFKVNGNYYSKPLSSTVYNKLMTNFNEKNFIFNIDEHNPEYFYEQGSMQLPSWSLFSMLSIKEINKESNTYKDHDGSFFCYLVKDEVPEIIQKYLIKLQIFNSLVNERNQQRKELDDCCFIYALIQTNYFSSEVINNMRLRIQNRYLSLKSINSICEEFGINLTLNYIDDEYEGVNKRRSITNKIKNAKYNITLNNYQNHYFIEEKTPFTTYYIKHLRSINDDSKFDKEYKTNHWIKGRYYISSSNLVRELFKADYFRVITYGECSVLSTVFYNEVNCNIENIRLEYNEEKCTQLIAKKKYKKNEKNDNDFVFYADFEADVTSDIHYPYLCVIQAEDESSEKIFRGLTCATQLLDFLPNNSTTYFHNLAYDIRFLACYGIRNSIIKGSKIMKCDIVYKQKTLHFKDTLPILSSKLSQLPSMFNLTNIHKEIYPYKYYTIERLTQNNGIGDIDEAGINEDKKWTINDKQQFITNINNIKNCRINDNQFNMWYYAEFYCKQDVRILRLSFVEFSKGFIKDFKIDPHNFISISSLANEVFNEKVYYDKNLYKIGGVVRKFFSHAIYGGRCMCAYNKKWHIKTDICDFDAVSLYPSAMKRLYTVSGTPKVITNDKLNMEFLNTTSAYVVEIEITKVNKHYPFPLIVQKIENKNVNDDNIVDPIKMIVDNIYLEDLIEFQHIEFKLIREL